MSNYIVTGASSGIGECVARMLLERGESVLAIARDEERLHNCFANDARATCLAVDLCEESAVAKVAEVAQATLGEVHGFVHCAGYAQPAPLGLIQYADMQRVIAVHAIFPLRFFGWLMKRNHHAEGCVCVLVSSRSAHEADVGNAAYAAAKGAVEGMFPTAVAELATRGIRMKLVSPGIVDTPMAQATWMRTASEERKQQIAKEYPKGLLSPQAVATEIVRLLTDASSPTGEKVAM